MIRLALWLICMCSLVDLQAQKQPAAAKPKLVVGLVVDQMRWDYLQRYADRYSNAGFKRLMNDGFNCNNTFINYTPTYTAAGHACIYSGSVPAHHGILGNYWYSRQLQRNVYCTEDTTVQTIGSTSTAGMMSPANMWATTINDELRMASNFQSKVIGIALKDRGSILPAGHSANAAYWFDDVSGGFISSSYYMQDLPQWLKQFNNQKLPDNYLSKNWNTLYPIETYKNSSADNKPYENNLPGEDNTFPHITNNISKNKYNSFRYTPHANSYVVEMAKAAIEGEKLGKGAHTDVLALSFSSTDYIGHEFGPNSIEIEDTYLRLDKDIAELLSYLDKNIGSGQYLVFLSSDHGATHIPGYLKENKIPAGLVKAREVETLINNYLKETFNISNGVSKVVNYQVYLNHAVIKPEQLERIRPAVVQQLLNIHGVANAFVLNDLNAAPIPEVLKSMMINGYNQKLSGDIQYIPKPQFYDGWEKGTSHGTWNPYDSRIPLIWYGWGIKKGSTWRNTYMTDIAATLAAILKVQVPSASIGNVIQEVFK
ncbi:alkaline phosphatase PafA [Aridibaculum aurantiacum]|uniref:alkaline phosphatase PafA n=1 Tax=Aridibaculum aurantiacum TaxID=2810307 RepID=UPI001A970871